MKTNILVVDDDPEILSMIRRGLIYEGYDVDTASDGKEALEKARIKEPGLVILDVMMPGMDGIEVSKRLRAKNAQNTVAFTTTFTTLLDSPAATNVTAETVVTQRPCPVCGGSGKISLNRLPLVNILNKSFTAGQQIELPNLSPIGADSPWNTSNPLDT